MVLFLIQKVNHGSELNERFDTLYVDYFFLKVTVKNGFNYFQSGGTLSFEVPGSGVLKMPTTEDITTKIVGVLLDDRVLKVRE